MGDLVPAEGKPPASSSNKEIVPASSAEIGQALFAAIEDQGAALGVRWPRTQIAITVRNAKPSLKDGIDPNLVLASCLIALRRGEPHVVGKIILDAVNSNAGIRMTRTEYERILALEDSKRDANLIRLRQVLKERRKETK